LVVLVDYATLPLSVLSDLPDEQFRRGFLDTFPEGLPVFEKSHVLHVLRPVCAVPVRVAILELSLILKIWREEQAIAFGPGQAGDVIAYGAVVEDVVGVEDEGVRGVGVVLVHVSGDDDGRAGYGCILDVEEAVAQRSVAGHVAEEVKVVLWRFEPFQVCSAAVDHV
jgi:hypothetical protein